ncbi:unnamed protein product [Lactuca virosa]|uniref:Secreted protein n=1 Tax=Lactuca virosa TaxID=75947 RepID=A0AAU9LAW4_9ASTR|nr:unnamed protein product [Lactuca virosa]
MAATIVRWWRWFLLVPRQAATHPRFSLQSAPNHPPGGVWQGQQQLKRLIGGTTVVWDATGEWCDKWPPVRKKQLLGTAATMRRRKELEKEIGGAKPTERSSSSSGIETSRSSPAIGATTALEGGQQYLQS